MAHFADLFVYRKARELNMAVYRLSRTLPAEERYGMADQMRRASVSIGANIAEGNGRGTVKDYIHFLYIARGSAYELESELLYCRDTNLAPREVLGAVLDQTVNVCYLLNRLVDGLKREPDNCVNETSEEIESYGASQTF